MDGSIHDGWMDGWMDGWIGWMEIFIGANANGQWTRSNTLARKQYHDPTNNDTKKGNI